MSQKGTPDETRINADFTQRVVIRPEDYQWHSGPVEGLNVTPLHEFEGERVALVKWAPHTPFKLHQHCGGEKIFVLDDVFYDEHGEYANGSWLRSPHLSQHTPYTKKKVH